MRYRLNRRIGRLAVLLLFLLPSLLGPLLHNHRCDDGDHRDCLACKWLQTPQSVELEAPFQIVTVLISWLRPVNGPKDSSPPIEHGSIRAPPVPLCA